MTVALAYNWWSLIVRLAHPKARLEAITSHPFLLSGIGRLAYACGQGAVVDHAYACPSDRSSVHTHRGQPAAEVLETSCGAVALRIGVVARVRIHRHSRDRIQLARSANSTTCDASHIESTAGFWDDGRHRIPNGKHGNLTASFRRTFRAHPQNHADLKHRRHFLQDIGIAGGLALLQRRQAALQPLNRRRYGGAAPLSASFR